MKIEKLVLFLPVLCMIFGLTMAQQKKMAGGMGNVQPVGEDNTEVQGFLDQVRGDAEKEANRTFSSLEAVEFATQLVNGVNYFIKARTGEGEYVHIRLHKSFQGVVSFHSLRDGKGETDVLEYF